MKFRALISVAGLIQYIDDPTWIVVDCRFSLDDPESGYRDYLTAHIPKAVYAHLEDHLSGEVIPGETGRHPLPEIEDISTRFTSWGIGDSSQVIAYDDQGGMMAARLWWLLKYLGHENVAVLDGGISAWIEAGQEVSSSIPTPIPNIFTPRPQADMLTTAEEILTHFGDPRYALVDSRAPERYRGEVEPIDPISGRIPGARNYFYATNLNSRGHFIEKDVLKGRFKAIFGKIPAERITFYCGSGVSAAHNVLAMEHAGLGMAKIYAGSWSHWITDPERPIAKGA
jgi:thiosulfate/3-mercaptopyruvate sulfurtransferase